MNAYTHVATTYTDSVVSAAKSRRSERHQHPTIAVPRLMMSR
jgi:hypothetical protein